MDKHFWQGKKVLITGYEGFLGSWLVRTLLTTGADIFGLDNVSDDIKSFKKEEKTSEDIFTISDDSKEKEDEIYPNTTLQTEEYEDPLDKPAFMRKIFPKKKE